MRMERRRRDHVLRGAAYVRRDKCDEDLQHSKPRLHVPYDRHGARDDQQPRARRLLVERA